MATVALGHWASPSYGHGIGMATFSSRAELCQVVPSGRVASKSKAAHGSSAKAAKARKKWRIAIWTSDGPGLT